MGMVLVAVRLTEDDLDALERALARDAESYAAHEVVADEERLAADEGRFVDVDKAWDAIAVVLGAAPARTGGPKGAPVAAGLVWGGRPVGGDPGHGPVRLVDADEVEQVAAAVATVDEHDVRRRYEGVVLDNAAVYPGGLGPDDLEPYVLAGLQELAELFAEAAERGQSVLLGFV